MIAPDEKPKEKTEAEKLYEMELHESKKFSCDFWVVRVPGGWIYSYLEEEGVVSNIFVPFNNEFKGADHA